LIEAFKDRKFEQAVSKLLHGYARVRRGLELHHDEARCADVVPNKGRQRGSQGSKAKPSKMRRSVMIP
jgi:hypothetical protein